MPCLFLLSSVVIVAEKLPGYKDPPSKPGEQISCTSFLQSPLSDPFRVCTIATFRPGATNSMRVIFYLVYASSKAPLHSASSVCLHSLSMQ